MRMIIAASGLAAVALSGCAPMEGASAEGAAAPRECFYARQASSFSGGDNDRIYVRVGVNDVFELQTLGDCPNINWSHRIGLEPRGTSNRVCSGFDADLIVQDPAGGPSRCAAICASWSKRRSTTSPRTRKRPRLRSKSFRS